MIVVGLTGGIGSGKTTVAKYFQNLGIPLYIADVEAKKLMNSSKVVKRKLIDLFGEKAYENNELNRSFLASRIFSNDQLLKKMNGIIHPKVGEHFNKWLKKQNSPYVLKEAAIIFENNLQSNYDYIITVIADKEERVKRLRSRDHMTEDRMEAIMAKQFDDQTKIELSDFVITNNDLKTLPGQVDKIHKILLAKAYKN